MFQVQRQLVYNIGVIMWCVAFFPQCPCYASSGISTVRPVLIDTSMCADIADAFAGERLDNVFAKNVVLLSEEETVVLEYNETCVMKHVFLDVPPRRNTNATTYYEHSMNSNDHSDRFAFWDLYSDHLQTGVQLVVVSCELIPDSAEDPLLSIPITTNFSFILSAGTVSAQIDIMQCHPGYCMLRVDTRGCVSSHFNAPALPSTPKNMLLYMKTALSMTGLFASHTKMPDITEVQPPPTSTLRKEIRHMTAVGNRYVMEIDCKNEQHEQCTPAQTVNYAELVATGLKVSGGISDDMFEVDASSTTATQLHFNVYTMADAPPCTWKQKWMSGNRKCPRNTQTSLDTDTFRTESQVVLKMPCVLCGINTYYMETSMPLDTVPTEMVQHMSLLAVYDVNDISVTSNIQSLPVKRYFLSSLPATGHGAVSDECRLRGTSVGVGSTLHLQLTAQVQRDEVTPATQPSAIVKVVCEGKNVSFAWKNASNTSIILPVLSEFAGKIIEVHIHDPDSGVPGALGSWLVLPALVFVRGPEIVQECLRCPRGKFSGTYGTSSPAKCLNTTYITSKESYAQIGLQFAEPPLATSVHAGAAMRNITARTTTVDFRRKRRPMPQASHASSSILGTVSTSREYRIGSGEGRGNQHEMPFLTYVSVGDGRYTMVRSIQQLPVAALMEFKLQVDLDTSEVNEVQAHIDDIAKQVLALFRHRNNSISTIKWTATNYYQGPVLSVPRDTTIVVEWDPAHPFHITNESSWQGPDAVGISLSYNTERSTTTFLVPVEFTGRLFYYCRNHENMGIQEMQVLEPELAGDDMKSVKSNVFKSDENSTVTTLILHGVYRINPEFARTGPGGDDDDSDDDHNSYFQVVTFNTTVKPELVNTTGCPDIADMVRGTRDAEFPNKILLEADLRVFENADQVSHLYLDPWPAWRDDAGEPESGYAGVMAGEMLEASASELWQWAVEQTEHIPGSTQLAVVTCVRTDCGIIPSGNVESNQREFNVLLRAGVVDTEITVLGCFEDALFCVIVIHSQRCLGSERVDMIAPLSTEEAYDSVFVDIMSRALAVSNFMLSDTGTPATVQTNTNQGQYFKGFLVESTSTYEQEMACVNTDDTECSNEQFSRYLEVQLQLLRQRTRKDNAFSNSNTREFFAIYALPPAAAASLTSLTMYSKLWTLTGHSSTVHKYLDGNDACGPHMQMTGSIDIFRRGATVARVPCLFCTINTYSERTVTPARIVNEERELFMSTYAFATTTPSGAVVHNLAHFVTSNRSSVVGDTTQLHTEESVVEIGTTLLLLREADLGNTTTVRVECDSVDVATVINNKTTVSLYIGSEYSGRAIFVHIIDTAVPLGTIVQPAVLFPRAAVTDRKCVSCPVGKFYGLPGGDSLADCVNTSATELLKGAQRSTEPVPRSVSAQDSPGPAVPGYVGNGGHVLPAVTYFEVAGEIITVLSLQPTTKMNASSHFALRAWLGNCHVEHVLGHSEMVQEKLLRIYHGSDSFLDNTQYNTTNSIQERRPSGMYVVQFVTEGNYSTTTPVPESQEAPETTSVVASTETTALPSTTPVPLSAFVVTMAVSMPMLLSEFDESRQVLFKDAIAAVAGVSSSDVSISKIESIASAATTVRRRLLSGGIRVDLSINAATRGAATQLGAQLSNPSTLNARLQQAGLPSVSMLQVPTTIASATHTSTRADKDNNMSHSYIIAAAVGGVSLLVIFIIVLLMFLQDRPVIGPSYEQQAPVIPVVVRPVHHERAYYLIHANEQEMVSVPWHV